MTEALNMTCEVVTVLIARTPTVPNNGTLPLLHYRRALVSPDGEAMARFFEEAFDRNGWPSAWRNGVFGYHHFHATAHEALGVYEGQATVQFGGPDGVLVEATAGDLIVVPAGVAHCRLDSGELGIVGAYPEGQQPDLQRPGQRAHEVDAVTTPGRDPLFGSDGPLTRHWHVG
mgnify:CR=1 FL=1